MNPEHRHFYTHERNHQILIALLKAHGIRNVVASPGIANSVFVGSIQNDPFFRIVSAVDERGAAYIACGLALESGGPVVLSCTGATAARNYMPGATEAYYAKLPVLLLTSSQPDNRIGHLVPQVTDRTRPPPDVCRISLALPAVRTADDEWACEVAANRALLELRRHGGGPVHLNLVTPYRYSEESALTCRELPPVRVIRRIERGQAMPGIPQGRIGVFVGSHKPFSDGQARALDAFCETTGAVVFTDHTSNYNGPYKIPFALAINQAPLNQANRPAYEVELLIHVGEVSGEEGAPRMIKSGATWRVSEDGELRDTFRNLTHVFEMPEEAFFRHYSGQRAGGTAFLAECRTGYEQLKTRLVEKLDRLPFSNVWIAQRTAPALPGNATVVLSILNTLRTWNYAEFKDSVRVFCPVGGFGIDGATSLALGASLADPRRPCYCVTGDLAFFYDLNALGNRHVGGNLRVLLVNNGLGVEFRKSYAMSYRLLGDEVGEYVAARGHFGRQSPALVRHYAEDLGFAYRSARNKDEFDAALPDFTSDRLGKPLLLEAFVSPEDEADALDMAHDRKPFQADGGGRGPSR